MQVKTLLLWDIDGTLLTTPHAGHASVKRAIKKAHGTDENVDDLDFHGSTDPLIFNMVQEKFGIENHDDIRHRYYEAYFEALQEELHARPNIRHNGVLERLEEGHDRDDIVQGLLTGNVPRGAEIKLVHYDLWHFFEFGAFGDDGPTRNDLGPHALRRASELHDTEFDPAHTFVIGDTPHDVACGKAIGANTIALATGKYSVEELAAHEPTATLADLSDGEAFWQIIEAPRAAAHA